MPTLVVYEAADGALVIYVVSLVPRERRCLQKARRFPSLSLVNFVVVMLTN